MESPSAETPSDMEVSRCVACKQEIPAGASICSTCKRYQRPWKNHLQYFAGLAGVATLILFMSSASLWLLSTTRKLLWYRDDVRVIAASTLGGGGFSLGEVVVVNRGDGDVFVSHFIFTMPGQSSDWIAPRLVFNEKLSAGQFARRDFPASKIQKGDFVRGLSDTDFEKLVTRAARGDPCFELVFFMASDSLYRELTQSAGTRPLNTFAVGGYLEYWGLSRESVIDVPITGAGVLLRDTRPECR